MGNGGASGAVTKDSKTLGLDSWESEVVGRVELQTGVASVAMDRMTNL